MQIEKLMCFQVCIHDYIWRCDICMHYIDLFVMQKFGDTALVLAAHHGHEQMVDLLLKAGADPNIQDWVLIIIYIG